MSIEKAKLNIQTVIDSMDFMENEESGQLVLGQGERKLLQMALKNIESSSRVIDWHSFDDKEPEFSQRILVKSNNYNLYPIQFEIYTGSEGWKANIKKYELKWKSESDACR